MGVRAIRGASFKARSKHSSSARDLRQRPERELNQARVVRATQPYQGRKRASQSTGGEGGELRGDEEGPTAWQKRGLF